MKSTAITIESSLLGKFMLYALLAIAINMVLAAQAYAVGAVLCGMIQAVMQGGMARAIATIGILIIGVGATLGKVSWTLAITVAVGIAALFGVSSILASLVGLPGCYNGT